MEKRNLKWQLPVLLLFIVGTVLILRKQSSFQENEGKMFGTIYHATYQYTEDLRSEIETELKRVDMSLSPFNEHSIISRINRNEDAVPDSFFTTVINRAKEISEETDGAFDVTVAPLVNVWGFGFKKGTFPDSLTIDSLMEITGHGKIRLENGRIVKSDPRVMINCSAIAKGYGSDVVARLFDRKGIQNYLIEIGGEVVVKGCNPRHKAWCIGISRPIDDSLSIQQELETVLDITNAGMATSGNYRNYYYKDGQKYAHTIDPRTGYPVQHSLLSATVIAPDCMSADAYATSFMVMGMEKARTFVESRPDIEAYFIYSDEKGRMQTWASEGMKRYMPLQHESE